MKSTWKEWIILFRYPDSNVFRKRTLDTSSNEHVGGISYIVAKLYDSCRNGKIFIIIFNAKTHVQSSDKQQKAQDVAVIRVKEYV